MAEQKQEILTDGENHLAEIEALTIANAEKDAAAKEASVTEQPAEEE